MYCIWPDETWGELEELHEMTHMSDDYTVVENLPENLL